MISIGTDLYIRDQYVLISTDWKLFETKGIISTECFLWISPLWVFMGTDTSLYKQFQPFGTDVFLWVLMSLIGTKVPYECGCI